MRGFGESYEEKEELLISLFCCCCNNPTYTPSWAFLSGVCYALETDLGFFMPLSLLEEWRGLGARLSRSDQAVFSGVLVEAALSIWAFWASSSFVKMNELGMGHLLYLWALPALPICESQGG